MANGARGPPDATVLPNGTTGAHIPAPAHVNRKKQKRREKEAAKKAAQAPPPAPVPARNGVSGGQHAHQHAPQYAEPGLDEAPYDEDHDFYSDEEVEHYQHAYGTNGHPPHSYAHPPMPSATNKKSRKKKKAPAVPPPLAYAQHATPRPAPVAPQPHAASRTGKNDRIWNTSTLEERERIREFWRSLGEDERKSLVKIEKEAVLRKMKEQQKHSCSCSVCGRKRTAIEEELEVLYDAYYEELEHAPHPRPMLTPHPPPGHYDDDEDEYSDEDEDGNYSNSEISTDGGYSIDERSLPPPEAADFLQFGSSLQVKGGILTVADDLLKNDGKKFIEMMEQLAERRMQREEEAQYQSHPNAHRPYPTHNHGVPPEDEEFDDEGDEEEGYEDDDYEEDDEDEDDTMTEEQRMEEGRRMFQIFAARMFEQRVLQAYREKVAAERQQRLLEELAEEDERKDQKEAKKAKEAQKRKEKKDKQRQQKAEEKARKEAEQAAREAEAKALEEQRLEEQRKRKEEQRKKKEAGKKAQDEERQRKEVERHKRQQEERERQQEAERKAREQKALEKKAKDEAKRKEREEREAKEKAAKEKKTQEEKERKERDAKTKAEKSRAKQEEPVTTPSLANTVNGTRKTSQPVAVALPPQLLKQTSSSGVPSPYVTPAVPKAPTPNRPRQTSQQGSHNSSPKTPQVAPGIGKPVSPPAQGQGQAVPKSILTKPPTSQPLNALPQAQPASAMPPIGPPPGMQGPPGLGMGNPPPGLNGFPGPMMPNFAGPRPNIPFYPPPQPGSQNFRPFQPPPGMHTGGAMNMGRGFSMDGPPGFPPTPSFVAGQAPPFGIGIPSHSRQGSGSYERTSNVESPIAAPQAQPIQRPAPIQRPSSVKPSDDIRGQQTADVDELADHLGSKALLDDEEDIPEVTERRTSIQQHSSLRGAPVGFGFPDAPNPLRTDTFTTFGGGGPGSIWGTPPLQFPSAGATWGNSPTGGFFTNPLSMSGPRMHDQLSNEPRLVWLRRMVCSACRLLSTRAPTQDGFIDATEVLRQIDSMRNHMEPSPSAEELKEACDIIDGTHNNGGGSIVYKESSSGRISHVKFIDSTGPSLALGEIGSPVPGHSVPVGFGGRFPGLGPQGF